MFEVGQPSLITAVVCTDIPQEEVVAKLESEVPAGTKNGWQLPDTVPSGETNPWQCPDNSNCKHYYFEC